MSDRLNVFALYEYGVELTMFCSGHIRLQRPLTYPTLQERVSLRMDRRYQPGNHDVVIVERLWRPDITLKLAERLVADIRQDRAFMIYAQDDNIFDLHQGMPGQTWLTDERLKVMELFASEADGVLVSTPKLQERISQYNRNIAVVPNALDERLLIGRRGGKGDTLVVGYMGTKSHDEDLKMVIPALQQLYRQLGDRVEFQIVGGVAHQSTLDALGGMPVRILSAPRGEGDYPLFMTWFTTAIHWDIAIAPLRDNVYNVCKSDIKLLDYSSIGCAGVYSRLAPYDGIVDGETGVIVDNSDAAWTEALGALAADPQRRLAIAQRAQAHLFGERTLRHSASHWLTAIEQLRAAKN